MWARMRHAGGQRPWSQSNRPAIMLRIRAPWPPPGKDLSAPPLSSYSRFPVPRLAPPSLPPSALPIRLSTLPVPTAVNLLEHANAMPT
jgi:hypothetical protein